MRYLKLALDVLMAATFVLLLNKRVLGGLAFHEIAGTAISVGFITHLLLNWDWVVKVNANLFSGKLPAKTRIGYGLNFALLLMMAFIIVSGILVSKILFPDIHFGDKRWLTVAHIGFSFLILMLVGIHVGLHWKWIATQADRFGRGAVSFGRYASLVSAAATLLVAAYGGYQTYQTHYLEKLALVRIVLDPPRQRENFSEAESGRGRQEHFEPSRVWAVAEGREPRGLNFERNGNPNAGAVLLSYLGVMSVFVIITCIFEKWLARRPRTIKTET